MSAQSVMDEFVVEQGWNKDTQLSLLMKYFDDDSDDRGLRYFLKSFVAEQTKC